MRMSDEEFKKVQELLLASAKDNDKAHELLLVPHQTPIVPAIEELIRERNEARATLAQYEQDGIDQLRALQEMIAEFVEGKDEKAWVREMLRKGFVPSIANVKARRERDEAEGEAQQWHDLVSRLRTYLDIPSEATHEDAPKLARDALIAAEVRGAQWMSEAVVAGARDTAAKVCSKRRDPHWME